MLRLDRHPLAPLLGLLLAAALLIAVAYQAMAPAAISVAVGPQDRRFVHNTHETEPFGGALGRWTMADTYLELPPPAAHRPLLLSLTLLNSRPPGAPDPALALSVQGRPLASIPPIPRSDGRPRQYRLLLPSQDSLGWQLRIGLASETLRPPGDARDLGVVLLGARLDALAARPLPPPTWQLLSFLLLGAMSFVALRGLGAPGLPATLGVGLSLALLALGVALAPLQFLPFLPRSAALASLAAAYGLAVSLLYRRQGAPQASQPAPLALASLVLLMGLAHWLMPVYQLIMLADGVGGVRPPVPTMVIGGVGLLLAGAGAALLQRPRLPALAAALSALALLTLLVRWIDGNQIAAGWPELSALSQILIWAPIAALGALALYRRGLALGEGGWRRLLVCVLAASAIGHLAYMVGFAFTRSGPDFWILYKATRDWALRGEPLYDLAGIELNHFGHTFKVPPFYGLLFLPWARTDGELVLLGHRILNTSLAAATLLAWLWHLRLRPAVTLGLAIVMIYSMRPLADTIAFGQIDIALLSLLSLTIIASQRGHDTLAGAAIALATLFKLYPAVLLAFFVVKGQWRALIGFAAAMLILNGMAVGVMGWEAHRVYLFEVLPRIGGGTAWVENQTLNGFLSRLAGGEMASNKFDHPLVALATYGGFALACAAFSLLAMQPAERHSARYRLQIAQFALLMVVFVPAAWMHYATITIVAFIAVLASFAERPPARWQAALFGLAYGLVAYGNQWSFFGGIVMGPLTLLGISYKFYGLLMLTAVLLSMLLTEPIRAWLPGWLPQTWRARLVPQSAIVGRDQ